MIALCVKLGPAQHSTTDVFGTHGTLELPPPSGGGRGGCLTPGALQLQPVQDSMHLSPGSLSSHGHHSNLDNALTPLSSPQATPDGLPPTLEVPYPHHCDGSTFPRSHHPATDTSAVNLAPSNQAYSGTIATSLPYTVQNGSPTALWN